MIAKNFKTKIGLESNTIVIGDGTISDATIDFGGKIDALVVPRGTTGQRPSNTINGEIRYNTTTSEFEMKDTSGWSGVATKASVSLVSDEAVAMAIALG